MPHKIGYVTGSGDTLAHHAMLATVASFATQCGWTVLAQSQTELILRTPPDGAGRHYYCGLRCWSNPQQDTYNIHAAGFIGYIPAATWHTQPGICWHAACAHNRHIHYWLSINSRRLILSMRVGTPVYEVIYLGAILPAARPSQYPYPMCVAGSLTGGGTQGGSSAGQSRFNYETQEHHAMPWGGYQQRRLAVRFVDGQWLTPAVMPWNNARVVGGGGSWGSTSIWRDTHGAYPLTPAVLVTGSGVSSYDPSAVGQVLGALDGVAHIPGWDNAVENTLSIDGQQWVVLQNVNRTGHADYWAQRLDD